MQTTVCRSLGLILSSIALAASFARADIYQWEWVDPNDHSLGKQQSSILCPDGAGADPNVYMNLFGRDLTQAYLFGFNLDDVAFSGTILDNAYMANAHLDEVAFQSGRMVDADLSGVSFVNGFQNGYVHMDRVNFSDANLTGTYFRYSLLTDVNFTRANLTGVTFDSTTVVGANFTDAIIAGARLTYGGHGFTAEQLYSTRSYRQGDLRGTRFPFLGDLRAWNFNNINLAEASFDHADLTNASFHHAQLDNAYFNGASVIGADFRGALDADLQSPTADRAIRPDGRLQMVQGGGVRIRNFRGEIGIHITGSVSDGGFDVTFDDQPWVSTISFAPGIPVELGSTLSLGFEDGTDPAGMIVRSFRVFDWTGVDPVGQFIIEQNGLTWDTSRLYTDGSVRLLTVPEPVTPCIIFAFGLAARPSRRARACSRRPGFAAHVSHHRHHKQHHRSE